MRILVITSELPYPTINGGRLRIYNLLKRIAQEHQVWLASHVRAGDETDGIPHLRTFCEDVLTGRLARRPPLAYVPELLRYSFSGKPVELLFHHSPELAHKVEHLFTQEAIDIVQIEETYVAHYLEHIPQAMHGKSVLTFYDIAFEMLANIARLERNPLRKLRRQLFSQSLKRGIGCGSQPVNRLQPAFADRCDSQWGRYAPASAAAKGRVFTEPVVHREYGVLAGH
jgi:hypothetical protein